MGADAFGAVIAPRCPVTGGLPTRMTETAFRRACTVKSGTDTRDWRYRRCKQQPLPPIRCRQCNGRRGNWPAELAITDKGEPMTTKTTTKPAAKESATKDGGKAGPSCAAVGRILTETIVSGRGEIQITIRPYAAPAYDYWRGPWPGAAPDAAPASTPTEAQP